jgi:signal transduction histidine kinase
VLRSLRSRLILASILWTGGLLMSMHLFSLLVIHIFPVVRGAHSVVAILVAFTFMIAGLLVARRSLTMFWHLREELLAIRLGHDGRVEGVYASEIQPLIDDLNGLLENRERAVKRAFATAGDLAHGLKTPLALLAREADRIGVAGHPQLAESVAHQVDRMSRQVNYHLARARAAASGADSAPPCFLSPSADALVRTLLKLHAGRELEVSSNIPPGLSARVHREDLEEILGNLLDNACKWANSTVLLAAAQAGSMVVLTVDDDGPGLAPAQRAVALERGIRVDEAAPGFGLGLAIVRDLTETYGGSVSLEDSPLKGLRAQVSLPTIP